MKNTKPSSFLKRNGLNYFLTILVVVLSLPSVWYLFNPGFINTDDGNWMIIRFSAFYQAMRDGQFPVRLLERLNFGYGYPVSNFLYPGFMYFAVPIKATGMTFVDTIKIVSGVSVVLSGVFSYLWLGKLFDKVSSFFGSLLYVYAPYHIFDLVNRGSIGELMALTLAPFVLWQIERGSIVGTSIGMGVLIISHNTLSVIFLGFILLYMVLSILTSKKQKYLISKYLTSVVLGLSLSAFFWIPAIFELGYTVLASTSVSDWNKYFADYNLIGISIILLFILVPIAFFWKTNLAKSHHLTILIFILGLFSIFLAIPQSSFVWTYLPVSFVQFPFRFLSLTILTASFLLTFLLSLLPKKVSIPLGLIFIGTTIYLSSNLLINPSFNNNPDSFYSTNEATTTVKDEYMPRWVEEKPTNRSREKVEILNGEGDIANVSHNARSIRFDYVSEFPSIVRINFIYYPGWTAKANGETKGIFYDNKFGLMDLKLPEGSYHVSLSFGETPLRLIADFITLCAAVYLVTLFLPKRKGSA